MRGKQRHAYGAIDWWFIFWIERIGFLILALSWVFVERNPNQGFLSLDAFRRCFAFLIDFWKLTTLLYLASFLGSMFFECFSGEITGKTGNEGKQTPVSVGTGFWVFGLFMEKVAVLMWEEAIQRRQSVEYGRKYGILNSFFVIIIPMWNIYFALVENSDDLLCGESGDHHDDQKKLLDGGNVSRIEMEEPQKQEEEDLNHVFLRAELTLFWVERLGFTVMAWIWVLLFTTDDWILASKSCLQYVISVAYFWICTNSFYFLVHIGKLLFLEKSIESQGKKEQKALMADKFGFWLERLALLVFASGVKLFASLDPQAIAVLDICFVIIFPLLNIYFAWIGCLKEFRPHLLDNGDNGVAEEEIQPEKYTMASADSAANSGVDLYEEIQLCQPDFRCKNHQCQAMLETLEDRIMGWIDREVERALEENLERHLEKMRGAVKKAMQKSYDYEEEYQKLKEQARLMEEL